MTGIDAKSWSILLAAGASKRFGSPKALAKWDGGTLLSRALATARTVSGPRVMVVTGAHHDKIAGSLDGALSVFNRDWPQGMGSSIRAGAEAVLAQDRAAPMVLILPVDQPFVLPDHLRMLGRHAMQRDCCMLTADGDAEGPPAAVPARFFGKLLTLRGPVGLKATLSASEYGTLESPFSLDDVDRQEDLEKLAAFVAGDESGQRNRRERRV